VIVHIDARAAWRALAVLVGGLVVAHVVAVHGDLQHATALDLGDRQSLARWAVVALLLLAAGLSALLTRAPEEVRHAHRWRVRGWLATLASVDAVAAVSPNASVSCRIATDGRWAAVAVGVVAVVALWSLVRRDGRALAAGWAMALGLYVAGVVVGADCQPGSVPGRVLMLAGAAGFVLVAVHGTQRADVADRSARARQQLGTVDAITAAVIPPAPGARGG
jgi:O-antigen ligase